MDVRYNDSQNGHGNIFSSTTFNIDRIPKDYDLYIYENLFIYLEKKIVF